MTPDGTGSVSPVAAMGQEQLRASGAEVGDDTARLRLRRALVFDNSPH